MARHRGGRSGSHIATGGHTGCCRTVVHSGVEGRTSLGTIKATSLLRHDKMMGGVKGRHHVGRGIIGRRRHRRRLTKGICRVDGRERSGRRRQVAGSGSRRECHVCGSGIGRRSGSSGTGSCGCCGRSCGSRRGLHLSRGAAGRNTAHKGVIRHPANDRAAEVVFSPASPGLMNLSWQEALVAIPTEASHVVAGNEPE